jgi:hypothetical protein
LALCRQGFLTSLIGFSNRRVVTLSVAAPCLWWGGGNQQISGRKVRQVLEKWKEIASGYESLEGKPYDEQVEASHRIGNELNSFLISLESEPRDTKLLVLSSVCSSPYFYRALNEARPPGAVAYTLISKGLYEWGMCATPENFREEVEDLTDALKEVELLVGVDRHRLPTLKNPNIDPLILEDEFESTGGGDADVIDAILANSVSPESLLRKIFEGEFDARGDYDGFDVLSDLISHPGTPDDILMQIVSGEHSWDGLEDEESRQELSLLAKARLDGS